ARNQADQLTYTVDKSLGEWGDKVPAADKDELVKAADELKELLKDQAATAESLNGTSEKVMGIFSRIGQSMYQQAQAEPTAAAAGGGEAGADGQASSGDDDVVEGEIVEEGGSSTNDRDREEAPVIKVTDKRRFAKLAEAEGPERSSASGSDEPGMNEPAAEATDEL